MKSLASFSLALLPVLLVAAAASSPLDDAARTLIITYSDGHVQTVALDRDAAMIENLRFGGARVSNLAGQWRMQIRDNTYGYDYVLDALLTEIGPQRWQVERTLRETNHSFHRTRIGATDRDCTVTAEGRRVVMICEGHDPNPAALGRYRAEYEGEFDLEGVVRGTARHVGVLPVSVTWEMRRR